MKAYSGSYITILVNVGLTMKIRGFYMNLKGWTGSWTIKVVRCKYWTWFVIVIFGNSSMNGISCLPFPLVGASSGCRFYLVCGWSTSTGVCLGYFFHYLFELLIKRPSIVTLVRLSSCWFYVLVSFYILSCLMLLMLGFGAWSHLVYFPANRLRLT